jgi:hypothetical protein
MRLSFDIAPDHWQKPWPMKFRRLPAWSHALAAVESNSGGLISHNVRIGGRRTSMRPTPSHGGRSGELAAGIYSKIGGSP